jgi:hypothetical protein
MKKLLFFLVPFLAFGQLAFSQNRFGLKAGANLSNQHLTFTPPYDHLPPPASFLGYHFGVFFKTKANKKWNFSSEINYSLVGSKELYLDIDTTQLPGTIARRYSNKIGYLEIPFALQYNFGNFYSAIGPTIAFRIFSKSAVEANRNYYRAFDVAGNVVAGYKVAKKVDVNVGYNYGLVNILKDQSKYGGDRYVTTKNRVLNFSILYYLK